MKIAILILAAGRSSRMKTIKQLLPVSKTTLLGVTIEHALQSNANKVYCVLGAHAEVIKAAISNYNIETIFNSQYQLGISTSIVSGVQHTFNQGFEAVLILLGDQPLITSQHLNIMIETFKNQNKKIIASKYNSSIGVPAIIPKSYFNVLLKLKGDKGAKEFLNAREEDIIILKNSNLMDIDTKEEYLKYLNSIHFE